MEGFRLSVSAAVARLTLARPPANVLDVKLIEQLHAALEEVEARKEVTVLLIDAEGPRGFSAGVEVRDHLPEKLETMISTFHAFCRHLLELDAITVAKVHGYALGGAMELLACCDFVIASDDATFAQPEIDLASFPPLAAALYPSLVGPQSANRLVLLGERLSAAEAREMGFVLRVTPRDELETETQALIAKILEKSPAALRLAKRALRLGRFRALDALDDVETLYTEDLAATEDMLEGLTAFLEKRKPAWKAR